MMHDFVLLITSVLFVSSLILVGFMLMCTRKLDTEVARKLVHILSSFWCLFLCEFRNIWWALIGPIIFIIINTWFAFSNVSINVGFSDRRRNIGFSLYPVSAFFLTFLLSTKRIDMQVFLTSFFILGFGDGCACILGIRLGKHKYKSIGGFKSIEGSMSFFIISFIICILLQFSLFYACLIAVVTTLAEAFSFKGFDNFIIPLTVVIMCLLIG